MKPDYEYSITNAFFGGNSLQKCIQEIQPDVCVFGHTHTSFDRIVGKTHYVCSPVGYMDYEHSGVDKAELVKYISDRLVIYDTVTKEFVE